MDEQNIMQELTQDDITLNVETTHRTLMHTSQSQECVASRNNARDATRFVVCYDSISSSKTTGLLVHNLKHMVCLVLPQRPKVDLHPLCCSKKSVIPTSILNLHRACPCLSRCSGHSRSVSRYLLKHHETMKSTQRSEGKAAGILRKASHWAPPSRIWP